MLIFIIIFSKYIFKIFSKFFSNFFKFFSTFFQRATQDNKPGMHLLYIIHILYVVHTLYTRCTLFTLYTLRCTAAMERLQDIVSAEEEEAINSIINDTSIWSPVPGMQPTHTTHYITRSGLYKHITHSGIYRRRQPDK